MPEVKESRVLPFTPEQMFDLVADVERYPEFLPWCKGARVYDPGENRFRADLVVGVRGFRETYTSEVILDKPNSVRVEYVRGPLRHLNNYWRFEPVGAGQTRVQLDLDFAFRNRVLNAIIGGLMHEAFSAMVGAFERRAGEIYGRPARR